MSHFLVIYDRRRRTDPKVERIEDAHDAQERLFAVERNLRDDPDHGVVLLLAAHEGDLVRTHGQFFRSVDELARVVG